MYQTLLALETHLIAPATRLLRFIEILCSRNSLVNR
jgi:hypothetical protein